MISEESKKIFLSKNHLQIQLQKVFFPLTLIQYVILSPKYYLYQYYITPNSILTNVIMFSLSLLIFVSFLYFSMRHLFAIRTYLNTFLRFLFYFEHIVYASGYLCNAICIILQSHVNVALIICVQLINNNLRINKCDMRKIVSGNWIYCFLLFLFYILNTTIQSLFAFTTYFTIALSVFIIIPWDYNILYVSRMTYLLRKQSDTWTSNLKSVINAKSLPEENENFEKFRWQSILSSYLSIIDAYLILGKITEIPIIYHVVLTFVQFITNIQTIIQFKDVNAILVLCVLWTLKHGFLLTLLSLECEKIHISLKNSQVVCLTTAYKDISVSGHQVCKRLRKESRKQVQPMSAMGLFTVNAALPLHLFSILATYTVVLLQFNFL